MYYIIGLGNPGEKYQSTRHNVGWLVLDVWTRDSGLPTPIASSKYVGRIQEGVVAGSDVTVLYPDTFMNKSGAAVKKLVPTAHADSTIVVYDDVDIPLGEVKISVGKGSGGHNGVQSIITELGSKDFIRVRVGICPTSFWTGKLHRPQGAKLPKYVLAPFTRREMKEVEAVAQKVGAAIESIIKDGAVVAMNNYN